MIKWSAKSRRYKDSKGRYISRQTVFNEMEKVRAGYKLRVERLTGQLQRGEINLSAWTVAMRDEIKAMHVTAAAIANGGLKQMSPALLGKLGADTRQQYAYLNRLSRQIASGEQPLNAKLVQRAKMYVDASRNTFSENERRMQAKAGVEFAKRVLHSKETCPGCASEAAKGKQPIAKLAPIGSQECLTNCKCQFVYLKEAA